MIIERQPNLYKYSISGYMLSRTYGDEWSDVLGLPEIKNMTEEQKTLYFEAMEEAPEYIRKGIEEKRPMMGVFQNNIKLAVQKIYLEKIKGNQNVSGTGSDIKGK
jgi:hypothetical protein